ncbi:MAG: RagB/SusD family nutrient uptake outer membrane protein [Bacteroidales bacterium]|nr:RagB/SusD family nutrient uptake outer membrane protein [Bacteroidales bacterium]
MLLCVGLPMAGLGGSLSSCSDFLEVEPQNIVTLDQFWNEESDVTSSIAGCYSGMQRYDILSRMMIWGEFRSDNVLNRGDITKDINLQRVLEEDIVANNGYADWAHFYNVINRCNLILKYAPGVHEIDPSYNQGELNAHIAEATALRSLCYFYLIRTFRDVPYTDEAYINDAQEMMLPQTDFYTILHNLINSLEEVKDLAVVYYPTSSTQGEYYQTGRITRSAIYAMLCEMYLWDQQYDKCIEYADKIVEFQKQYILEYTGEETDYSDYYGYPLYSAKIYQGSSYYGKAFNRIFVRNNSLETIFELSYVKDDENMLNNEPVGLFYGGTDHTGYVQPSEYIQSQVQSSSSTLFLKNKYDGRRYENFLFNSGGEVQGINKYVVNYNSSLELPAPTTSNFYSGVGYWGSPYSVYTKDNNIVSENKSNWIIYRLTDIMLLKAEALAWSLEAPEGTLNEADEAKRTTIFQLCNATYKRSLYEDTYKDTLKYDDYKSKSALLDLVYDERQRELMFEGKRYYDLVRRSMFEGNTDYLRSKCSQKSTELSSNIDNFLQRMEAIFWPVLLDETKANPNLIQNPAFGSGESSSIEKS